MVRIICDICGAEKPGKLPAGVEWILGSDLEMEGRSGLQRSIRFLDRWNDARILELGAIHLCSTKCRDRYMKASKVA